MAQIVNLYNLVAAFLNRLQSPLLLAIRLYWGYQFCQDGWGSIVLTPPVLPNHAVSLP